MWAFLIIMFSITIGFSLIFLEFGREENGTYLDYLYGTYQVWYGNYDDSEYSPSQKIITAMILFLLSVVLLNMLIAIMGDTYGKVQEAQIFTDSSTRLNMCLEAMSYLRIIRKKPYEKGYLIFCSPKVKENEGKNEWEERINKLEKYQAEKLESIKKEQQSINKEQQSIKNEVTKLSKTLQDQQVNFENLINLTNQLTKFFNVAEESKVQLPNDFNK